MSWSYTRGRVSHAETGAALADVKRNYSGFPFLWVEDHPSGHDYLLCGEDYQGQTFIELDTARRRDFLPDEAAKGFGFCWADYELMPDGVTLKVEGCYWACPYEYKFFDVSDPIEKGWPELGLPEEVGGLDTSDRTSLHWEDGMLVWRSHDWLWKESGLRHSERELKESRLLTEVSRLKHQKRPEDDIAAARAAYEAHDAAFPDQEDAPEKWEQITDHEIRFKNENGTLVLVGEIKSEFQLAAEKRYAEYQAKSKAQRLLWMKECPVFQHLVVMLGGDAISRLVRFSYPSMVMRWDGDPNPASFRVSGQEYDPDKSSDRSVTLSWGVVAGPIRLEPWVRGKGILTKVEFPRTVEGLHEAWQAGRDHLGQE